jgi:hypothetical protein
MVDKPANRAVFIEILDTEMEKIPNITSRI